MQNVSNQPVSPVNLEDVNKMQRGAGRPPAKHSSPDYSQLTVYVRKDVRRAIKIRLFEEGLEMSALVERLLIDWLANQGRCR
jgi:hypothetical protein